MIVAGQISTFREMLGFALKEFGLEFMHGDVMCRHPGEVQVLIEHSILIPMIEVSGEKRPGNALLDALDHIRTSILNGPIVQSKIQEQRREIEALKIYVARLEGEITKLGEFKNHFELEYILKHGKPK